MKPLLLFFSGDTKSILDDGKKLSCTFRFLFRSSTFRNRNGSRNPSEFRRKNETRVMYFINPLCYRRPFFILTTAFDSPNYSSSIPLLCVKNNGGCRDAWSVRPQKYRLKSLRSEVPSGQNIQKFRFQARKSGILNGRCN
jgi:hypothetical protein